MSRLADPALRSDWVGLGEASRMLGVAPGTLRRWSDLGRVDTFTTPGGHRRYRRAVLERMVPDVHARRSLAVRSAVSPARLARVYRAEARVAARSVPWIDALDDDRRLWFREHGRRLAEALLIHLDAPDRASARHHLGEATAIAAAYGRVTSGMGVTLSEALEGFLQFRRPFLNELGSVIRKRDIDVVTADELSRAADRAMDALLVAAMAAHSVERAGRSRPPLERRSRTVSPEATGHA